MSFSSNVKAELIALPGKSLPCCALAQAYGLLLFGREFSARAVRFTTEHEALARFAAETLSMLAEAKPNMEVRGKKWEVWLDEPEARRRLRQRFGHDKNETGRRVNWAVLENDCCTTAFLRGAFLSCAAVAAPERQYHLEFSVSFRALALDLRTVLEEAELPPHMARRKESWLLYYKESAQIEAVLAFLGSQRACLAFIGVTVEKDVRNRINRQINFETANMTRTAAASVAQLEAIAKLRRAGRFALLPEALKEAARLREENPEASLQELCALAGEEMTRSGMNHRLKRIVERAGEV
jgi:DNA-binding protein WhiA